MSRPRLHIVPERWGAWIPLEESEKRYLIDVLRSRSGRRIEVFDGRGRRVDAEIIQESGSWGLRLPEGGGPETTAFAGRRQTFEVVLAVGLLKGKKFELVVRMLTELGVSRVVPLLTERTVVRPADERMDARLKRWRQITAEAARQSGQSRLPELAAPCALDAFLHLEDGEAGVLLYEGTADMGLGEWLASRTDVRRRLLIVGPEGGFTPEEVQLARQRGFAVADLGAPVLRAETAAVATAVLACLDSGRGAE